MPLSDKGSEPYHPVAMLKYSSRIKWCTAGGLGAVLTQTFNVRKASSSCPSWLLLYILVFFPCYQPWPGWQLHPFLLAWKAAGSSEDKPPNQHAFPAVPCWQRCAASAGRGWQFATASLHVVTFPLSTVCSSVLLLSSSVYLLLLRSVSQQERGWNVQAPQKMGLLRLSHRVLLTPSSLNGNSLFTNPVVTAASSLDLQTWLSRILP